MRVQYSRCFSFSRRITLRRICNKLSRKSYSDLSGSGSFNPSHTEALHSMGRVWTVLGLSNRSNRAYLEYKICTTMQWLLIRLSWKVHPRLRLACLREPAFTKTCIRIKVFWLWMKTEDQLWLLHKRFKKYLERLCLLVKAGTLCHLYLHQIVQSN